jgi:hypothetical protein
MCAVVVVLQCLERGSVTFVVELAPMGEEKQAHCF